MQGNKGEDGCITQVPRLCNYEGQGRKEIKEVA